MGDHVEAVLAEAIAQRLQQWLDPRLGGGHLQNTVKPELHGVGVAPQQRVCRIETGERRRRDRRHIPILSRTQLPWGAVAASVDKSGVLPIV
ncbi:MAG TPA: hypothetical protein DIW46_08585 [Microbacterium sp.]|nr:hypothetical protein [Microbacterium sp.]